MKNVCIVVLATNRRRTPAHCGTDAGLASAYWTVHGLANLATHVTIIETGLHFN